MLASYIIQLPFSGHILADLAMTLFFVALGLLPAGIALFRRHPQVVPILALCLLALLSPYKPYMNIYWTVPLIWSLLNLSEDINFLGQKKSKPQTTQNAEEA